MDGELAVTQMTDEILFGGSRRAVARVSAQGRCEGDEIPKPILHTHTSYDIVELQRQRTVL